MLLTRAWSSRRGLTPSSPRAALELLKLRDTFDSLDSGGKGCLTLPDLTAAFEMIGLSFSRDELAPLLGRKARLDFDDFWNLMRPAARPLPRAAHSPGQAAIESFPLAARMFATHAAVAAAAREGKAEGGSAKALLRRAPRREAPRRRARRPQQSAAEQTAQRWGRVDAIEREYQRRALESVNRVRGEPADEAAREEGKGMWRGRVRWDLSEGRAGLELAEEEESLEDCGERSSRAYGVPASPSCAQSDAMFNEYREMRKQYEQRWPEHTRCAQLQKEGLDDHPKGWSAADARNMALMALGSEDQVEDEAGEHEEKEREQLQQQTARPSAARRRLASRPFTAPHCRSPPHYTRASRPVTALRRSPSLLEQESRPAILVAPSLMRLPPPAPTAAAACPAPTSAASLHEKSVRERPEFMHAHRPQSAPRVVSMRPAASAEHLHTRYPPEHHLSWCGSKSKKSGEMRPHSASVGMLP
ncbi:hypothetical protein AB1Y20_012380 [Prymnesium parvum]|uniref:EF-hand domain-containing protein n=1 Tax=Prymnesium parvum TaxID=97485 RepID=A0AB34IR35_PRYPA